MRILIAPDKFKGSLTAAQVAAAIQEGVKSVYPEADCLLFPMADGGEGFLEAMNHYLPLKQCFVPAADPLHRSLNARYGWLSLEQTAVIELADTAGLQRLHQKEYDALNSSTYGTGLVIRAAHEAGAKCIILGIGGSATTDAGTGILQGLGFRFLDQQQEELKACGENLRFIEQVLPPDAIPDIEFIVATDVDNPLYGPEGAAAIFAPQKGAAANDVRLLDEGLRQYAAVLHRQFGKNIAAIPGTGAAGGILASLLPFFKVKIQSGAALLMQYSKLEQQLDETDLIFTGEGQLDAQTLKGKLVYRLAEAGRKRNIPVIAVCGQLKEEDRIKELSLEAVLPLVHGTITKAEALSNTKERIGEEVKAFLATNYGTQWIQ